MIFMSGPELVFCPIQAAVDVSGFPQEILVSLGVGFRRTQNDGGEAAQSFLLLADCCVFCVDQVAEIGH